MPEEIGRADRVQENLEEWSPQGLQKGHKRHERLVGLR